MSDKPRDAGEGGISAVKKDQLAEYLHVIPPVLFLALAGIFSASRTSAVFEPPFLLPVVNTALVSALPFIIAFLAARTYARQGTRMFILFGCAMVAFGMGSLLGGWGLLRYGKNFSVTVHNTGSLLGGLCHLGGLVMLLFGTSAKSQPSRRGVAFTCAMGYSAVILLLLAVSLLTIAGALPTFFVQDQGPTSIRQAVLIVAMVAYGLSAIHVVALHAQTRMKFLLLYANGLFLTAVGLGIVLSERSVGNLLGWIGRASQYTGSIYFVAAMLVGVRETRAQGMALPDYLSELFRSHIDAQVKLRTKSLVDLNTILQDEVVHRREAEEELRQSEERLRLAAEATGFGIYNYSFESRTTYYSPEFFELFGLPPDARLLLDGDLVGKAVHPDDQASLLSRMNAANDPRGSGLLDLEFRIVRTDREVRWLRVQGRTLFRGSGDAIRPIQAAGIVRDVTESKLAEERLREREEMYRSVIENSLQGIAIIQDGRIVLCNDSLCRMNGYSKEEAYRMTQRQVLATIHPEDRPGVIDAMQAIGSEGHERPAGVVRLLGKSGRPQWVEVLGARTTFMGRPALQLSYVDVTERRHAEAAYHSLIDHAMNGMAIVQNGRIIFANQVLADIFGYSVAELLRLTLGQIGSIIQDEDKERAFARLSEILTRHEVFPLEKLRLVHKDGSVRWVEAESARIDHEGGPALQVTIKNVTAAMVTENELKRAHLEMRNLAAHLLRVREVERRKIAQDIHDQLGQTLAALKMDLHWLEKRLGGNAETLRDKLRGTIELGERAIVTVQRIASDLRPRMLDDLGLAPALNWLGADFARRTKIDCKVRTDFPPAAVNGNAATSLYRVAQEALANVGRHSHANHAEVRLYESDGKLILQVEDDGIGINDEQAAAPDSYGLIGIRERVEELGGRLLISGEPGFGTILLAHVPLPKEGGLA